MDGDEFTHRYQLLKKLVEGPVITYLARASSGDRVMTHFLQGTHASELLDRLDALPEERRRHLRTITDLDGTPVVVTDYLDDFDSFRSWTSGSGSDAPAGPPPTPDLPAGEDDAPETGGGERIQSDEPGEFTRMFEAPAGDAEAASGGIEGSDAGTGGGPEPSESVSEPSEAPPPEASGPAPEGSEPASDEPASDEPGEFTQLFEAPTAGGASEKTGSDPSEEGSVPADRTEPTPDAREAAPGEGDRPRTADADTPGEAAPSGDRPFLFRSPVQGESAGETDEPAASGGEEPSGRDRRPGTDEGAGKLETSESDGEEAGTDERASDEPGEFTRKFGSAGDRDDVEPPERGGATGEGSATDAFRSPDTPSAGQADAGDPGAGTGGAAAEGDRGPGEFTRMFGSRGGPADGPPDAGSLGVGDSTPRSSSDDDPDDYLRRLGAEPPPSSSGPGRDADAGAGGPTKPPSENPPPEESGVEDSHGGSDLSARGPSDYTRIVRGRGPQGAGASAGGAPTPTAPPSREEETRHWPYLAALGGIFLVAIVLLVVFLLTGGGDEAPAEGAGEGEPATEEVVSPPGEEG